MSFKHDWTWDYYKGNLDWLQHRTIYLTLHGSRAYGTNLPESDTDYRGVCIAPEKYIYGALDSFYQTEFKDPDTVIFDIKKFVQLAQNCNPNVIEIMFTDDDSKIIVTPLGEKLLSMRDLFITKRVRYTFAGYAASQMRRIRTHRAWILKPVVNKPERKDFGLLDKPLIPKDQLEAAEAAIRKKVDSWSFDFLDELNESSRIEIKGKISDYLTEIGISMNEDLWIAAVRQLGFHDNFIEYIAKEKKYSAAKRDWDNYQEWKKNRNPKRAELEAKHNFDCYSYDTEFLTDSGFKLFDDIKETDNLATVCLDKNKNGEIITNRPYLGIEYEKYTDKFDSIYNGSMYRISGVHTDVFVTANHRMLINKLERDSKKKYGWELKEVSNLPDTFQVLTTPRPKSNTFCNKEFYKNVNITPYNYLRLLGWYLSDGCMLFNKHEEPKSIRISQIKGGKLSWRMARWYTENIDKANCSLYDFTRPPNETHSNPFIERVLDIREEYIVTKIFEECGCKKNKRIPRWCFKLAKASIEILLFSLIKGDGTKRNIKTKDDSYIYYSSMKDLADDVQELAIMAGWETSLWGPYESETRLGSSKIYQVHLRPGNAEPRTFIRCQNVSKETVINHRVVCFTVPNGTLITRRNGKISIHGNCKHAMHLVRLYHICKEVLETGKVNIKRPDAEELLEIRNGAWTYEQLEEWFNKMEAEIPAIEAASTLPKVPDVKEIDRRLIEIIKESL